MTLALVLGTASAATADRLILMNGAVVHGEVARIDGGYLLTAPDGRHQMFPRESVKRAAYESRITPEDAAAMLGELRALLEPILDEPEPNQFVIVRDVTTYDEAESVATSSARFDVQRGAIRRRPHATRFAERSFSADAFNSDRGLSGSVVNTVDRDKTADNVFADEWLRYVAMFEAVAQDSRYRTLTDARRHADSLGDFARRAPEDYAAAAGALREALRAVDECLRLAADTRQRVAALPLRELSHDEAIRELENKLVREQDRLRTARDYWRQKRRVQDAEDRLRERIASKETEIARARRVAERKINEFAHAREVAHQQLAAAEAQIGNLADMP
jgi:hypothetical protein